MRYLRAIRGRNFRLEVFRREAEAARMARDSPKRIAIVGGGPAGLYFAISMKLRDARHDVTVFERNRPDDTFGWGVVLSEETLQNLTANDPVSAAAIRDYFAYWDDVAVVKQGTRTVSTGHGFCGIGRRQLLLLLQERATELGVVLRFEDEVADVAALMASHDLVVAADGLNSQSREAFADVFQPDVQLYSNKFVWLGTHQSFDRAFTFIFEPTEHGWMWAHAYQFEPGTATFIVECSAETWARARVGVDQLPARAVRDVAARQSRADGRRRGERAFLDRVGDQARARKRGGARGRTARGQAARRRARGL